MDSKGSARSAGEGAAEARRARGRAIRERAQGRKAAQLEALLGALDPELPGYADEFIFGGVWARPGLGHEERMLVAIAVLAAGGHEGQLRNYLYGALQDGIDPVKVQEALVMTCVYAGFPAALSALHLWREVLRAHEGEVPPP